VATRWLGDTNDMSYVWCKTHKEQGAKRPFGGMGTIVSRLFPWACEEAQGVCPRARPRARDIAERVPRMRP